MTFRIYYDIKDCVEWMQPKDLHRREGVICIAQPDPDIGREVLRGYDWYYYRDDKWWGADLQGMLYQMTYHTHLIECVVQGAMVPDEVFSNIIRRAKNDPGLPEKTSKRIVETP